MVKRVQEKGTKPLASLLCQKIGSVMTKVIDCDKSIENGTHLCLGYVYPLQPVGRRPYVRALCFQVEGLSRSSGWQ